MKNNLDVENAKKKANGEKMHSAIEQKINATPGIHPVREEAYFRRKPAFNAVIQAEAADKHMKSFIDSMEKCYEDSMKSPLDKINALATMPHTLNTIKEYFDKTPHEGFILKPSNDSITTSPVEEAQWNDCPCDIDENVFDKKLLSELVRYDPKYPMHPNEAYKKPINNFCSGNLTKKLRDAYSNAAEEHKNKKESELISLYTGDEAMPYKTEPFSKLVINKVKPIIELK